MPVNYEFIRREDGKPEYLNIVDAELAIVSGQEYDEQHYSHLFQTLSAIGTRATWHEFEATPETVLEAVHKYCSMNPPITDEKEICLLQRICIEFLAGSRYTYKSWR